MREKGIKTRKNTITDYVVWVDILLNAAIFAFYAAQILKAFQIGIDQCLESGFEELELGAIGTALMLIGPVVAILVTVSLVMEVIYLILRLCRKEPFITEKYSMISAILKVFIAVAVIGIALIF